MRHICKSVKFPIRTIFPLVSFFVRSLLLYYMGKNGITQQLEINFTPFYHEWINKVYFLHPISLQSVGNSNEIIISEFNSILFSFFRVQMFVNLNIPRIFTWRMCSEWNTEGLNSVAIEITEIVCFKIFTKMNVMLVTSGMEDDGSQFQFFVYCFVWGQTLHTIPINYENIELANILEMDTLYYIWSDMKRYLLVFFGMLTNPLHSGV